MKRAGLLVGALLVTALAIGVASIASATQIICLQSAVTSAGSCPPRLVVAFGGEVSPTQLPKTRMAPVTFKLRGRIANDDGSQPSALKAVTVEFDRSGALDAEGLPVCKRTQLEMRNNSAVQRACARSIVGTGIAHVATPASQPVSLSLTLFNGGVKGGATTLFIRSSATARIFRPIVTAVKLRNVHEGPYRLTADVKIPSLVDGSGSLLDFSLKIKRIFAYKRTMHSYAMANCAEGRLSAKVSSTFHTGEKIAGIVIRPCTSKG
jgi:hypothetical protein